MMPTDIERWLRQEGMVFLADIGIKRGQRVLDFGCGAGTYTIPVAKVVGKEGKVYALDKDTEVLNQLEQTAKSEGLKNIVSIVDQSEELKINLEDESIDAMLLYDILHYMQPEKRRRVYENGYRILKPGAILSVYPKHCKSDEPLWNLSNMELEDVISELNGANFVLEKKFFKNLIHDNHYQRDTILNFRKGGEG